ncbi:uncharacterized protein LOC114938486 isoform X2 [Nylanderia fulva]|uniref:uncharacterized protein LOC114938486 isoform X2 n=1 Tax=Nylanderia fulva TaxID=613905 RepID=UPI0010FB1189|nr:uncharacterized protein LOC114938486 isoform X2 [Nylanderia fulva]
MSYTNFGRGRGLRPRGTRGTASSFGRARFLHPPFRHVGPLRPGRPALFMPWQQNNVFFQPHLSRGNPQFRPGGRRKSFCNYNARFPAPNRLPVPPEPYEEAVVIAPDNLNSLQIEYNQTDAIPQQPLLGSEEERQQKISETADRLRQKLSSFSGEMHNIWNHDKLLSSTIAEDDCENDENVVAFKYGEPELDPTSIDPMRDTGKVNSNNSRFDNTQYVSNNNNNNNSSRNVGTLGKNEDESRLEAIPNNQMTNLSDENEYLEMDNWLESVDNFHNLEQSDLHDNNVESGLLDSDLQCQFNTPVVNTSQDCCDQQDISQGNKPLTDVTVIEQDVSKKPTLQDIPLPNLTGQDISQHKNVLESEQEPMTTNLEIQNNVLESQIPTISSVSNNCNSNNAASSQPIVTTASVLNNVTLDNQLSKKKTNPFHTEPPKLSRYTKQRKLPIDFDPSTPPPILTKQDQPRVMPLRPIASLPPLRPLFDLTTPPPGMRPLLTSTISRGTEFSAWNNVQNPVPAICNNIEMHAELNPSGGFISRPLPLEMSSPGNVYLSPHIDTIQFSPFSSMPSDNPAIGTNVSSHPMFQMHTSHNTYTVSPPELLQLSDCNVDKDDSLNDMQEALKFAKQMTSVTERRDQDSNSKVLCESNTTINNVESISLPPGEPKSKSNTLKKTKRNDTHSKKIIQEPKVLDHLLSEESVVQDTNTRSTETSLMNEQERPKVIFNLNNKTKIVNTRTGWRESSEKRNGIIQPVESEKMSSISKKNFESTLKRSEKERKNLKTNNNNSGNKPLSESIGSQSTVSCHKKIQKNAPTEKSHSNISSSKNDAQKSNCVEKNESSWETSWKNKIINKFLKMSKNDIFNMVNNTSLRKFDVIMKRLVKEKKSTLSLGMRQIEDEKMKLYDQQEFMKQLNAMLETDAVVSITDLSTEFIHHLNEVLQLDVQLDNHLESVAAASSSQNNHLEDANHVFSPATLFTEDCANKTAPLNYTNQEKNPERNKSHITKTGHDRDTQIQHTSRNNEFNLKDDTCSTVVSNKSSISSKLSALQHDLDDIFSEVTKKNQTPAAVKERKHCSASQRNANNFDDGAIMRSTEKDALVEDDRVHKSENCAHWIERCNRWKRKEQDDPYAYRNLTKEEWEARHGIRANSVGSSSSLTKKINNNENLSNRERIRKSYQRRRHSSESSKHTTVTRHRTLEKDKHKKSRRHSDDRRHSTEYLAYHDTENSNSSSNSNTSTSTNSSSSNSSSSSSSNDSSGNTEPNVTKLLRAIKEKEKVAKKMSLNETIRDEVNAEIERERKQKSKKSRKYKKWRKREKLHHKKKKKHQQSKKITNSSESLDKTNNEEVTRMLTENEIKKEVMENQITQEVIVKEELDIGQEENTRDTAEFANASNHVIMENKSMYSPPESQSNLESALLTLSSHAEDRPPTASPTQPKTKAQLKQMPETNADTNDNKIFFKIFTSIPEDWDTINPTECSENLNKSYQTTDCNRNETETSLPIDNFARDIKHCGHLLHNDPENTISQQSEGPTCASNKSFIAFKMKADTDILASANVSNKTTIVASDVLTADKKPRTCRKIDIKTYFERNIQRRINKQRETKRSAENLATSTQDLSLTPKIAELESTPVNKSTSVFATTYDGSLQDPRLLSARAVPYVINSKDNDIAQTLRKNVRQKERQTTKKSKVPKIASKPEEGNSNRVIDTGNAVEQINQNTLKENVTDKKLQDKVPSDSKRFQNIRSEGSKELKLKKEMSKAQKKKSAIAIKSISIVSTKYPLKKTTKTKDAREMTREKESDDKKMKIECTASSCKSKVNNSYADMKSSIIVLQKVDNNNELSHNVDKNVKEFIKGEIIGEDVGNIESTDLSETMRNEEDPNVESGNTASLKITNQEEQRVGEFSNVTSELDVQAASISSDIIKAMQVNVSTSSEKSNATKELSLKNYTDQIQVEESNNQNLPTIKESDAISRLNIINKVEKDQGVNDVEMNENKENIVEPVMSDCIYKSVSADEDSSSRKTTTELSLVSNENSTEQQTGNGVISPESAGSPFKGFLQDSIEFEEPKFNLELHKIDVVKDNFLNNVNCATRIDDQEETSKEKMTKERDNYETLERPYANDMSINENFDIAFGNTLLASNKETVADKSDKTDLTADEDRRAQVVEKSSHGEIVEDENIIMNVGDEAEKRLMGEEEKYAELTMKESMFINEEEEINQDGTGTKDLTSKLTTTTDPSLSDALDDAAISDDALRLPENQNAEHLNNHNIYLETNIPTEKITCDKLPGFDSDEQLDNDMFYLDDRLQSAAAFDNKDEATFSVHQETSPARYDIIPSAITPETTMIADLSHDDEEARYKFDLKRISSEDNSDLPGTSQIILDTPPRMLNVPTKAALKETTTNLFLKSLNSLSTNEGPQGMLNEKAQGETNSLTDETPMWHVDIHSATKTHSLDTHTKEFVNINTISVMQNSALNDKRIHTDASVGQNKISTGSTDKCLHSGIQCNSIVELEKLDEMMIEKTRERTREDVYKDRKKRNGIFHKLKDKRQMKYRSGRLNRNGLARKMKKQFTGTRETILARMLEIDIEMHKLMTEKMKLHDILLNNTSSTESTAVNRENDAIPEQVGIVPTQLTSQLSRNAKTNRAKRKKHSSTSSKNPSINKRRKIIASRSSEDDEMTRYTQKTKMPVIRWKKTPRLEETLSRQEKDVEEEEDVDKTTEQQTFASKDADVSSALNARPEDAMIQKTESNASKDATIEKPVSNVSEDPEIQKTEANVTLDHDAGVQDTAGKTECDVADKSSKPALTGVLHKSADNRTDDSTGREHVDADKDVFSAPSKVPRVNCQVRGTSESLSIYSDDSTWDSLVQNTASEVHENRNVTGLVLLDEKLKEEQARSRKLKAIVRKKKKQQLDNYLKKVNNLTIEEEELPLSKLYIMKLRQKRDLLDSLSQRKEDGVNNVEMDPEVLKNVEEVINAVAENRVEDLYEPQAARSVSNDIPTTSHLLSQPEKHQFYVDVEANANSDWPSREKENLEETAGQQQNNNDVSDGSNHVFKVVNQSKIPFYDERNVEPDSSITPEETLIESHSLNCQPVPPKDLNNVASRNFDIKVSVPKILIKDDFSLGLLQKFKNTESSSNVIGTELVDSTTNAEKSLEKTDKDTSSSIKSIQVAEEEKREEKSETNLIEKDGQVVMKVDVVMCDNQNNVSKLQKDETISMVKGYSDTTENEDSGDSVGSNDKIAMTGVACDSDSVVEKVSTGQKKSDAEQQPSCDANLASKQDYRDSRNMNIKEKKSSNNPESGVFEAILDQNTSSMSIDRASEKSEESNMSVDQRSSLERATASAFSFDKVTANKALKTRRKSDVLTPPVRRSTRCTNENVKTTKVNEVDSNSNSSELEPSLIHERVDQSTQRRSRSPAITWAMRDEKILTNVKRNRAAQKATGRRGSNTEVEIKTESRAKSRGSSVESATSSRNKAAKKRAYTDWEIKNCKVRLIDCKHTLLKQNVSPEILEELGIIAINPYVPSDVSYPQCAIKICQDIVMTPAVVSEQSSCSLSKKSSNKENTEIEILDEKPMKSNDDDSASMEVDNQKEETMKTQYTVHTGPILDIKVFEKSFLAASEDGKIYRYSQRSNGILNIYKGHKSAVTCLHIYKSDIIPGSNKELMYSGSLDGTLRCYNIMTAALIKNPVQINSPIQCMDQAWGMIFIGTKSGHVSRFQIKSSSIKGHSIAFSDTSVLALKATNEGPRRILIVAARCQPITIRDAQNGLFLRTISGQKNHTVYSLMRHNNLIYCGTSSTSINVFDFTTGEQTIQYDAGVGIVCMRLSGQLLFAGCYDGNIYVFDTRNHKLVCSIPGPGNMLLSIEVVHNKIIAGSKDKRLHSWQMPTQVRALL